MKQLENGTFIKITTPEIYNACVGNDSYSFDDVKDAYVELYEEGEYPGYQDEWDEDLVDALALDDDESRIIYECGGRIYDSYGVRNYITEGLGVDVEDYGLESEEID